MSDPEPIPTRKSIDQLNGSFENFDVLSITKKIQQQTRSIEDEIVKVQEILRKQQENSIQKSISKQSLMKEHHARQNLRQQVKNTTNSENSPQNLELARQSQSLDPRGQVPGEVQTGGLRIKTNLNYQNNQETAEILSKIQKPGANRSPQPINQPPLHGIPEKIPANTNAKTSRLDENGNGDQLNSLKMKRRLKPSESSNPQVQGFANDYQDGSTNLNVQVPFIKQRPGEAPQNQVHGQSGQDINQMRDKFFSSNNKQDFNNLPNNTFHKLFNNPNQQPMERNGANIKPHHSDSIKPDDINGKQGLPPISYEAGQSPQQIVKQKARRLAQASNDRRGMESLPNPNQMRESLEIQGLKGYGGGPSQSNNTFTPLRGGETGSNKFKNSSGQLIQNDDDNGPPQFKGNNDTQLRRAKFASSNTNNDNLSKSSNVGLGSQIQQKVAMNNFLTPIVFVSNNYHGVQPNGPGNGNRNSDFQEFVDFDQIKNQMAAGFGDTGQNQHIQMGYPQNSTQPLNRDIIFEEQEGTARDGIQDQKSQGYLPPLQQKSQFQSMKQGIQAFAGGNQIQRGLGNRGSGGGLNKNYLNENSSSVTPETITNLAGEQARLGAMLSKMPANTTLYRQQVQNQPSPQMNQIHKYPQYANSQRGPPEPFVQRFVIDSNNYNNGGALSPKKQRGGSLPPQYNINQASPARLGKGQWGYDGSQQQQYIDEEEEEENSRQDPRCATIARTWNTSSRQRTPSLTQQCLASA
ncbi:hypothetical protein FGO68_gene2841 [Halteria grandinella]|uniref:Uncharacterized protein n=1 Tax=Halteria grandinella TaxID=5974 RepID=A0A8J8P343_HALGN|nr:hypothetical protein FGO68_gene2841 [Halteria grandinella]